MPEGGADAHSSDVDPRREQRKIRRAAITSVAGGAIAIVGAGGLVGGALMIYLSKAKLGELADANGGHLPPGDAARQRAIATWQAAPIVLGVSAGVLVVGAVMAAVGAAKVRRLRENRRTTVAFSPAAVHGGLGIGARF